MIRVAVLVSGQLRTWSRNCREVEAMFRRSAGPDGVVHWYGVHHPGDLSDDLVRERDWAALVPLPVRADWFEDVPWGRLKYPRRTADPRRACLEQWSGLLELRRLVSLRPLAYDFLVRLRPDLCVLHPIESFVTLSRSALMFPRHSNWKGLNDRFYLGPPAPMLAALRYPLTVAAQLRALPVGSILGCEQLLGAAVRSAGTAVERTAAVLQPRREDGTVEAPVYRTDRGDLPP
jgi:hypothetical protein